MMLIISVLRYRATLYPLEPALSRRKLKVVSGLPFWVDSGLWNTFAAVLYKVECRAHFLFEVLLCMCGILHLLCFKNISSYRLFRNRSSIDQTKQMHEKHLFKSSRTYILQ